MELGWRRLCAVIFMVNESERSKTICLVHSRMERSTHLSASITSSIERTTA
jgi:hypothetical protein